MKEVLSFVVKLLHPPKWVLLFLPPVVFALLISLFVKGQTDTLAYPVYFLSAYCLTIWVIPIPALVKKAKAFVMGRLTGTQLGSKYVCDLAFRGSVSIYQGMTVNFLYVVFRVAVGVRYASVWFLSMARSTIWCWADCGCR